MTVLGALLACGGGPAAPAPVATPDPPLPPPTGAWDGHGASPLPAPGPGVRDRRRMDVDQLDASVRAVTGGIGWDVNGKNQLASLSATLGKPDYLQNTYEDLSPSLLFQKFLEDAAASVCDQLVARERAGGPDNVFLVLVDASDSSLADRAGIEANLSAALLRFHGRDVPPGDPRLEPWMFLFEGAELAGGGDPILAWETVCVALLTHPDFYTY